MADFKPRRAGRLRRGVYILPSVFTVGTLVCGYLALLSTLRGTVLDPTQGSAAFDLAARAIGWAIVFDGLDGRIARLTNSSSDFGREFDSLADVITFGVAPAFLAYAWGIRTATSLDGSALIPHLRQAGWIITFAFVICGAARLARFNIESGKASSDRRHFIGLPIPAAAGVVAAIVHWRKYAIASGPLCVAWLLILAAVAFLMVSRVRYFSFKTLDLRQRRPYVIIILIGVGVWAIWIYSEPVLLTMALVYAASGPIARLTSRIRPQAPPPAEVHAS